MSIEQVQVTAKSKTAPPQYGAVYEGANFVLKNSDSLLSIHDCRAAVAALIGDIVLREFGDDEVSIRAKHVVTGQVGAEYHNIAVTARSRKNLEILGFTLPFKRKRFLMGVYLEASTARGDGYKAGPLQFQCPGDAARMLAPIIAGHIVQQIHERRLEQFRPCGKPQIR